MAAKESTKKDPTDVYVRQRRKVLRKPAPGLAAGEEVKVLHVSDDDDDVIVTHLHMGTVLEDGKLVKKEVGTNYRMTKHRLIQDTEPV